MVSGANGLAQIILAVISVFVARASTPTVFGTAMSAVALALTLTALLDFGVTAQAVRQYANGAWQPSEVQRRLGSKVATVLVASSVALLLSVIVGPSDIYMVVPAIAVGAVIGQVFKVPLQAAAKSQFTGFALIGDRVVLTLTTAILWASDVVAPSTALAIGFVTGPLAGALISYGLTPSEWRVRPTFSLAHPWRGSRNFGLFGLAVSAQSLDLPVLALLAGPHAAGQYAAVQRWIAPMNLVTNAVSGTAVPFVAAAQSHRQASEVLRGSYKLLAFAALACLAVAVSAPWLTTWVLGDMYAGSSSVLQLLALSTTLAIFTQPMAMFLMSRGRDAHVAAITVAGVAMQFMLLAVLAGPFAADAAPLALCLTQGALILGYGVALRGLLRTELRRSGEMESDTWTH